MRKLALLACLSLASCGVPPLPGVTPGPASSAPSISAAGQVLVPQLMNTPVAEVDRAMAKVGLVPILRYEPAIITDKGAVAGVDPAPGTRLALGSTITVTIAGDHGPGLADYIDAHREAFIGLGADTGGVLVIAIYSGSDLTKMLSKVTGLAEGKTYRVQPCAHSWADLQRVQLDLGRREFSADAPSLSFATAIDPLACAVRLTADLPDSVIATLTAKYQGTLVIQKGSGTRGG
jgi:hypothetical protein